MTRKGMDGLTGRQPARLPRVVRLGGVAVAIFCSYCSYPCSGQLNRDGLSTRDVSSILVQIPVEAPLVYLSCLRNLVPERLAVVVGTTLYRVPDSRVQSARLWIFVAEGDKWTLTYATDMDIRLEARGLSHTWQITLERVEAVNLDEDELVELAVWWGSGPEQGFSMSQYGTIFHTIDFDPASGAFREITDDQVVCSAYTERVLLLNVDQDDTEEIVVLNEIWDTDTCVICDKRFRIDVWTVAQGRLVRDPGWNSGQPYETGQSFSLLDGALVELIRLVVTAAPEQP